MENKNNFAGIIIPVIIAVILLTVLPIVNSINVDCPPCEELPTLYTQSISISGDTLTITPNSNNGAFVTGYKIYVDDILLDTITSTTYDLSNELTEVGTYEIYVTAYATAFTDSAPSNVEEYVVEPVPTGFNVTITVSSRSINPITFYDCADFENWNNSSPIGTLLGTLQPGESDTYFVESGYVCAAGITLDASNFVNSEPVSGRYSRIIKILGDNASFDIIDED